MRPEEQDLVNDSIGVLSLFHPENPTGLIACLCQGFDGSMWPPGVYDLILGQQAHYTIARRLIELFCQQFDAGLCQLPYITPIPNFSLDGNQLFISDPKQIQLPREGRLKVSFLPKMTRSLIAYLYRSVLSICVPCRRRQPLWTTKSSGF